MPLDPDDRWIFYVHDPEQNLVAECYDARAASALLALYGAGTRVTADKHGYKDIIWCESLDDGPVGAKISDILQERIERDSTYRRRVCAFWDDGKTCQEVTDIGRTFCPEHLPPGRDEERAREQAAQRRLEDNAAAAEEAYKHPVLEPFERSPIEYREFVTDDDRQHAGEVAAKRGAPVYICVVHDLRYPGSVPYVLFGTSELLNTQHVEIVTAVDIEEVQK